MHLNRGLEYFAFIYYVLQLFALFFFFFQAEDGIRDGHVTGVQTCALPISHRTASSRWVPINSMPALGVPHPHRRLQQTLPSTRSGAPQTSPPVNCSTLSA